VRETDRTLIEAMERVRALIISYPEGSQDQMDAKWALRSLDAICCRIVERK
jgi:hypothetical protein